MAYIFTWQFYQNNSDYKKASVVLLHEVHFIDKLQMSINIQERNSFGILLLDLFKYNDKMHNRYSNNKILLYYIMELIFMKKLMLLG
jgi:hypothetical protein